MGAVQAAAPRPIVPLTASWRRRSARCRRQGANLGELLGARLPVPAGFVVTTAVYDAFVAAAGLDETITSATAALDGSDPAALAAAEATIAAAFDRAALDPAAVAAIGAAYEDLADGGAATPPAVAVRSSATAEDLPGASFAGQQETLLGVTGAAAVVAAVRQCWRSLWAGRAIAYRQQQGSAADRVAMAVVVQRMVEPAAAGVLFTADPVTSDRSRMVIEAVPGRGEALVQGSRTPDRYVVDHFSGHVHEELPADPASGPLLDSEQVRALHALARRAEAHFGQPQDLEWAVDAAGKLWLLQARPITTLEPEAALPPCRGHRSAWLALLFEVFPEGDRAAGYGHRRRGGGRGQSRARTPAPAAAAHPVRAGAVAGRTCGAFSGSYRCGWGCCCGASHTIRTTGMAASCREYRTRSSGSGAWSRPRWMTPASLLTSKPSSPGCTAPPGRVGLRSPGRCSGRCRRSCGSDGRADTRTCSASAPTSWRACPPSPTGSMPSWRTSPPTCRRRPASGSSGLRPDRRRSSDALATHPEPGVRAFGDRLVSFLRRWGLRESRGLSVRLPPWEAQPERVVVLIGALAAGPVPAPSNGSLCAAPACSESH